MDGIIGTFRGIPISYCKCGYAPEIVETYDTLQIVCKSCGLSTAKYFGDYYDDGFMGAMYAEEVIEEWNRMVENDN
ncbi:MAG: hypothetical protein ACI4XN_04285 [Candidatus Kurthia intestinigallinarum]